MSDKESVFRFELNETLYFESGQEVAEIIGVSLDPEISIQTFHEYVSIRGVIELSGDYHKVQLSSTLDDEPFEVNDYHEKNFIEQVSDKTDTLAAFTHRFPVEISIPSYRVTDLEEVTVQVASFDYEIPNHHQMKLMAIIEIEGINEETHTMDRESPSLSEEKIEEEIVGDKNDEATLETEENDVVDAADENMIVQDKNEPDLNETEEKDAAEEDTMEVETTKTGSHQENKSKKSLPLSDFFKTGEQKKTNNSEQVNDAFETEEDNEPELVDIEEDEETSEIIRTNEQGRENEQNGTPIHSLSEMFEHDTEETYTKMRLCIVQDDDTIETIAERYETTTNQLILKNHLTDETITEGQLLYIPERVSK